MLKLGIPARSLWDETREIFIELPSVTLELEHSLVSLAKWESKWKKPFLDAKERTREEMFDYVRCMSLKEDVDPMIFRFLSNDMIEKINQYTNDSMTATWFTEHGEKQSGSRKEVVTAEVIYYWMISLQIPMECQYWHLNRLMTLIRVCNAKNTPPKKMKGAALAKHNTSLNAARRRARNSKG